jgi:hypothetical protein
MTATQAFVAGTFFGVTFLVIGFFFSARLADVVKLDKWLTSRLPVFQNRKPQIDSTAYKVLFRVVGALLMLLGTGLLFLVVAAVVTLARR